MPEREDEGRALRCGWSCTTQTIALCKTCRLCVRVCKLNLSGEAGRAAQCALHRRVCCRYPTESVHPLSCLEHQG